ncbi:excinuclease ABC subunit A [Lactobacillus sp. S2-2]|uniref:Y-family DNA polymerase n=1 Tax=Lactobacillus sp. S2-2 TaxID=2692917 RepID=UPI001F15B5FB|nr:Y-family DNA polymerase [Lactobacillus sp. S2-2]MCF6515887.1 excinuclease ABC subunit A [Lactobacillus sp. S2-2]
MMEYLTSEYDYQFEKKRVFFLIDSKSFYASVESVERGLNPLKSVLVVLSEAENTNGGLILAASPQAKKKYGISNVSRQRDLPAASELIKVPPRMNLYIKRNLQINNIYRTFTDENHLLPYSIDESILDMTKSWHLFGDTPLSVAKRIQKEVRKKTGIYLTVGIGDSPVLAKLALDLEAKKTHNLIGVFHYSDVPKKLWPISNLSSVWSIGKKTELKLNKMGINSIGDLAHTNPYKIRSEMGIIGEQLYALSWGVDRTDLAEKVKTKSNSYSNSQVLPKDYTVKEEIEVVIKEMADQVATRIRSHHKQTTLVSLYIGFSYAAIEEKEESGFKKQLRITPTNDSRMLMKIMTDLFEKYWNNEAIRNIGIDYGDLRNDNYSQLNLFETPKQNIKSQKVNQIIDKVRQKFGITSLMRGVSYSKGGTAIQRSNLVGGHNGGNSYE